MGTHDGFPNYTIGQRSGLGSHGERVYVTGIDPATNTVTIGRGNELLRTTLLAKEVNLIGPDRLEGGQRVEAQVRYKDTATPATISPQEDGSIRVVFDSPKRAITPGQSLVMYDGDRLIGGGVIEKTVE